MYMKMPIRVGDRVVCVDVGKMREDYRYGEWRKGRVFIVRKITATSDGRTIYWPKGGGNGFWGEGVALCNPTDLKLEDVSNIDIRKKK